MSNRRSESSRVVLLRTTEDKVLELNRLQVELARLNLESRSVAPSELEPLESAPLVSDSLIQELISRVSADSVLATIQRLQAFSTRYATTDSCRAAVNYALQRMQAYNCDTVFTHSWQTGYAPNGIGVKYGRSNPRRIYALCAHIDNTSPQAPTLCPGADDNGSGSAVVLEACRVLADCEFENTFHFLIFTGEEQGLLGSEAWVSQAAARGDSILGAMNFDMVSYGLANRDSMVVWKRTANPNCTLLANAYCANADTYTTLKYWVYTLSSGGATSDHASFWNHGYPCIRDKELDVTPMYHQMGDTIGPSHYVNCGTNDVPITVEAIKAAVATFAKLAGVHQVSGLSDFQPSTLDLQLSFAPNPFFRTMTVRYHTDRPAWLRFYDGRGARVKEFPLWGDGALTWNGRDRQGRRLSSGVYFGCLEGGAPSNPVKVVLLEEK